MCKEVDIAAKENTIFVLAPRMEFHPFQTLMIARGSSSHAGGQAGNRTDLSP
jgi:hypothetical protein